MSFQLRLRFSPWFASGAPVRTKRTFLSKSATPVRAKGPLRPYGRTGRESRQKTVPNEVDNDDADNDAHLSAWRAQQRAGVARTLRQFNEINKTPSLKLRMPLARTTPIALGDVSRSISGKGRTANESRPRKPASSEDFERAQAELSPIGVLPVQACRTRTPASRGRMYESASICTPRVYRPVRPRCTYSGGKRRTLRFSAAAEAALSAFPKCSSATTSEAILLQKGWRNSP
jgi:hypothetical protein